MEREEIRHTTFVNSPGGDAVGFNPATGTKLPLLLTARPGNVGIQIDAFRTMKMFHRPRCEKFTAQFQGINYENHSMENYTRIVERSQVRARIVAQRLEKLKQHEAKLLADEQNRRHRRREREIAEQRHQWLLRQAAKKAEQRQHEGDAASTIQRVVRGAIARRFVQSLREMKKQHGAATYLQAKLRAYAQRRQSDKQRQEHDKERRLQAATTIQRQARIRQRSIRRVNKLPPTPVKGETVEVASAIKSTTEGSILPYVAVEPPPPFPLAPLIANLLQEVGLELVFSSPSQSVTASGFNHPTSGKTMSPTRPIVCPRRPVTIKRVGGGYRQTRAFHSPRLRTSKPPDLAVAITPRPPPPREHLASREHDGTTTRTTVLSHSDSDADENVLLDLVQQLDLVVAPERLELFPDSGFS